MTRTSRISWLTAWHSLQALLFLGLWISGLSLHYVGDPWVPLSFPDAVRAHNFLGGLTVLLWVGFVVANRASGHARHYLSGLPGLPVRALRQIRYYGTDFFRDRPDPFVATKRHKRFNPAQQLAYVLSMYVLMPISAMSGLVLLFPFLTPERMYGWGGLWPVALVHLGSAYLLSLFVVTHMYAVTLPKPTPETHASNPQNAPPNEGP